MSIIWHIVLIAVLIVAVWFTYPLQVGSIPLLLLAVYFFWFAMQARKRALQEKRERGHH
ncbi:hypothetical protein [Bacillus fonticola]|uniref:hypothetical protein n=1 Tax=Bacillus fonticola TaxID=2728853 RepID=UPI0014754C70|nr:hypothetical protein [Bacillus fonticola]